MAVLNHPKVVNSAYFSPISGSKILTTCIDNRCCSNLNALSDCLLGAELSAFLSSSPGTLHWKPGPKQIWLTLSMWAVI